MLTARPMTGARCPDIAGYAWIDRSQLWDAVTWKGSPSSYAIALVVRAKAAQQDASRSIALRCLTKLPRPELLGYTG